jgi:GNAT superfamily N-acetyltransferase
MVPGMATSPGPLEFLPADLASGDAKSAPLDWREFDVARVPSADAPLFSLAYERLLAEFGPHELETREVIARRLSWFPAVHLEDAWLRYELLLVRRGEQFVAARDHTVIVRAGKDGPRAIVHLSHVLVDPSRRRTGLAGWLRAWPIQSARAALVAAGFSGGSPITLAAEMEHPDPQFPARWIRLQAYEKAGFLKADPAAVPYLQPDFRPPAEIDASGQVRPLPFALVLRRVGREQERTWSGAELRDVVEGLYGIYGATFRPSDMDVVRRLSQYPAADAQVALVPPTR